MTNHRFPTTSLWSTAALAVITLAATADATTIGRFTAEQRLQQADLIVLASVVQVEHRNSAVLDERHVELPHAFVTIAIERTFKGDAKPGDELTLRQQGGPDGRGRTLQVSGVPRFAAGDRDVFFIKDNGSAICPLVGWEQGRLRVVRGELFNDQGQDLWVTPDGDFAFGDKTIDIRRPGYPARVEAEDDPSHDHSFHPPAGSFRADEGSFGNMLDMMMIELAKRGEMPPAKPVASVAIDQPFFVDHFAVREPPVDTVKPGPLFRGQFDEREAEMVRRERKGEDVGEK